MWQKLIYSSRGNAELWFPVGGLVVVLILLGLIQLPNRITIDAAVERFYELSQAEKIEIVRHSNNSVFGDTRDVTFELVVDGKPTTGRCTSGFFSEMICRLYTGED